MSGIVPFTRTNRVRPSRRPGKADAAGQRWRKVVGVTFELESALEQRSRLEILPERTGRCDQPERDRRSARSEPTIERNSVREDEALPLDGRKQPERTDAEVRLVGR